MVYTYKQYLALKEDENNKNTSTNKIDWGVGGLDGDTDTKDKQIINKDSNIIPDDKKQLNDIISKIDSNVSSLGDLSSHLQSYNKVNKDPLDSIITKLKAFKEAIKNEIDKI